MSFTRYVAVSSPTKAHKIRCPARIAHSFDFINYVSPLGAYESWPSNLICVTMASKLAEVALDADIAPFSSNEMSPDHRPPLTMSSFINKEGKNKRARYSEKRRREVADVRRKGACFPCRVRKVAVSATSLSLVCNSRAVDIYALTVRWWVALRYMQTRSAFMPQTNIFSPLDAVSTIHLDRG